ncbi:hypothetical protein HFP57_03480 [Parasphingopyxis algicola]|uniref:P-II family nitrogen regulator n=1 Tax=Parasphingopyxis algicola TaxID=2026624 RepID=UPI0015A049E4|nr:hypothetical protein [Parasphingopyxis algicola]QLC24180.1 hypothetical protein HFP57_03480 [Parasphingopyxis algicola]
MVETVTRKRIEILVDKPLAHVPIRAAADVGIAGYSLIPVQSGAGRHGSWRNDRISGAENKVIFLTIASEEKADALVDQLAPKLDSHSLLLTVSDVQVVRGDRF